MQAGGVIDVRQTVTEGQGSRRRWLMWLHGRDEHRVTHKIAIGGGGRTHEGDGRRAAEHAQKVGYLRCAR